MITVTQHDLQARTDYELLKTVGILTARDVVRWHLVDKGSRFDFSPVIPLAEAAEQAGIQVIWNLCHYGWPEDVDLFSAEFVNRFERYCRTVARFLADRSDAVRYYAPINEISFFAWAASRQVMFPHAYHRDDEIKCQLVRAAIAGCEAIWREDRCARILHGDPVIHVVPPRDRPDLSASAKAQDESQFVAWDMLCGVSHPELGGHPRYLDLIGVNFYHANEWEFPDVRLRWEDEPRDDRWVPLHQLIARVYDRYRRPILIAETSHFGAGRGRWICEIGQEAYAARSIGIPLEGICIYPILDRPDWEDFDHWHNSGLWDVHKDGQQVLRRRLNPEYAARFRAAQELLAKAGCV